MRSVAAQFFRRMSLAGSLLLGGPGVVAAADYDRPLSGSWQGTTSIEIDGRTVGIDFLLSSDLGSCEPDGRFCGKLELIESDGAVGDAIVCNIPLDFLGGDGDQYSYRTQAAVGGGCAVP